MRASTAYRAFLSKALHTVSSQPNVAATESPPAQARGSQAEALMQDLTKMRLLGRGGCGSVYEVGHASMAPYATIWSNGMVGVLDATV